MRRGRGGIAVVPLVAALFLAGCAKAPSDEHVIDEPATIEEIDGSEVARITLTEPAAERIDLQTGLVEAAGTELVVPSAAVFVDPEGGYWVYTNPEPLVFIRQRISIDREEGDHAFLTDGPPVGTKIVTVGVPELYGTEYEVGH